MGRVLELTIDEPETVETGQESRRQVWLEIVRKLRDGETIVFTRDKFDRFAKAVHLLGERIVMVCSIEGNKVTVGIDEATAPAAEAPANGVDALTAVSEK